MTTREQRDHAQSRELHPRCAASPVPYCPSHEPLDKHVFNVEIGRIVGRGEKGPPRPCSADLTYDCERSRQLLAPSVRGSVMFRPSSALSVRPGRAMPIGSPHRQRPMSAEKIAAAQPSSTVERQIEERFGADTAFQYCRGSPEAQMQHIRKRFNRIQCAVELSKQLSRDKRARSGYYAAIGPPEQATATLAPLDVKYDALTDWKKFARLGAHAGPAEFNRGKGHYSPLPAGAEVAAARASAPNNSEATGDAMRAFSATRRVMSGAVAFSKRSSRGDLWDTFGGSRR
jgi:hypothetical protein